MTFVRTTCVLCACLVLRAEEKSPEPVTPVRATAPTKRDEAANAEAHRAAAGTVIDLAAAQQMALRDNPSLKAAAARVQQARERVKQARAAWYPSVYATASAANTQLSENDYDVAKRIASNGYWTSFAAGTQTRLQGEVTAFAQIIGNNFASLFNSSVQRLPLAVSNSDRAIAGDLLRASLYSTGARHAVKEELEAYSIRVVADWIVFDGFDRKFSILEARYGKEQTEASYADSQRVLLEAVAQAYYAAQLARENISIAEADRAFNGLQLKQAEIRKKAGAGLKSDVLNFQVRVNSARAALISAKRSFASSRIALAELLALQDARFPDSMDLAPLEEASLEALEPPDSDALVAYARGHRPDLRERELNIDRANAAAGRAAAPFYPEIHAQISRDGARGNDFEFGEKDFSTTIGVSGTYELFAGGRHMARLREAQAACAEAEQQAGQTDLAIASEVRRAVEELRAAQERLVLERANAVYVQENRDLVEKGWTGGVEPLVRLNEAQRDLIEAQANLALARVQLQASWHKVRTATGESLQNSAGGAAIGDAPSE